MAQTKTALQQLDKWLIDKWSDPGKLISCLEVSDKIDALMDIEMTQIVTAYNEGATNDILNRRGTGYYTTTFTDKDTDK